MNAPVVHPAAGATPVVAVSRSTGVLLGKVLASGLVGGREQLR